MNIKILRFERRNLSQEGVKVISHDLGDLFWRKDSLRSMTGGNKDQVVVFFLNYENLSFDFWSWNIGHLADDSVF